MTVVILHPPGRAMPPYRRWLADVAPDLVLVTGPGAPYSGFGAVRSISDYDTSARVETAVLDIAAKTDLCAIVATGVVDHIRAAGLRDHLELPGPSRDTVLGLVDGVRAAELLARAGVASVPRGRVRKAIDLHWYAHEWGHPLRIRSRRVAGWPQVAVLADKAELIAFTADRLPTNLEVMPSLMAEPVLPGTRCRAVFALDDAGACSPYAGPVASDFADLAAAALSALDAPAGWPMLVEAVRSAEGEWLVDTVNCDPVLAAADAGRLQRAVVAAQTRHCPTLAQVV